MKYWEIAYQHLKKHGKITNIEIMDITNTTCPHSIIRDLKKHGAEFKTEDIEKHGKKFRIYYLIKPITEKQIKKPAETEMPSTNSEANQMSLGLLIQKTEMSFMERRQKYGI